MKRGASVTLVAFAIMIAAALLSRAAGGDDIALPNGTELVVRLTTTLSSKGSEEADPWMGKSGRAHLFRWAGGRSRKQQSAWARHLRESSGPRYGQG